MVDNAPSVGIVRFSKNPVDAREKNIQQRAKSLSLAGASVLNLLPRMFFPAGLQHLVSDKGERTNRSEIRAAGACLEQAWAGPLGLLWAKPRQH